MPRGTLGCSPCTAIGKLLLHPVTFLSWPRAIVTIFLTFFLCGAFFLGTEDDNSAMYRVRLATPADIDDVIKVAIQAMPFDPQWDYRYPYRAEFPSDHYKYTKMLYDQFANIENDDWRLVIVELLPGRSRSLGSAENIIEGPERVLKNQDSNEYVLAATGSERGEVVAFSVWNVSYINKRKHGLSYQPQNPMQYVTKHGGATRKDMNPLRQKAFRDSGAEAEKHFAKYGNDRITLQILGTHPNHWRRGYGTSLCRYGMRIAAEDGLTVTLVAGQIGLGLYRHLNFTSVGKLVKQVPGEKIRVLSEALVWDPRDQAVSLL